MIVPLGFTYFQASRDGFRTKSNRVEVDCVRFCSIGSIIEPNRTIGVRLSSIGFWFDFVRLDTPGIKEGILK